MVPGGHHLSSYCLFPNNGQKKSEQKVPAQGIERRGGGNKKRGKGVLKVAAQRGYKFLIIRCIDSSEFSGFLGFA